jgi:hypothetical protein
MINVRVVKASADIDDVFPNCHESILSHFTADRKDYFRRLRFFFLYFMLDKPWRGGRPRGAGC